MAKYLSLSRNELNWGWSDRGSSFIYQSRRQR